MDTEKEILDALDEAVKGLLEKLQTLDASSDEYRKTAESLKILRSLQIDDRKAFLDHQEKVDQTTTDDQLKREQMRADWFFKIGDLVMKGLGIVLPLRFYAKWMKMGFKFEETGTFTSSTFKNLIHFFRPVGGK